jgi:DNA-binding transcriptional MerR regulator
MARRIEEFTVGELAKVSGVSVRTLHHYDEIGLLKPAHVAENRYRLYGRAEALRLQEILFYRQVGMSLQEIARVLAAPADAVDRLTIHRKRLLAEQDRTAEILKTLDATIAHLKGERAMSVDDLYRPFSPEQQAAYEKQLIAAGGAKMKASIAVSKVAIGKMPGGIEAAMQRLKAIEAELVTRFKAGVQPDEDALHNTLEDQRALMTELWGRPCGADGVEGLADTYENTPDFVTRYETLSKGFSKWLPEAMRAHAARLRQAGQ